MSKNVKEQLQLNVSLPSGSKKPLRKSKSLKNKGSEPTQIQEEISVTVKPEDNYKVPAQVKAEPYDVEEAMDIVFKPNPGPQTYFLSASEREVLYGGAAGGGKSYAMLADPLHGLNDPNFSGLLVRHTTEELRELIQKSQELYPRAIPGIKWSERKSQ